MSVACALTLAVLAPAAAPVELSWSAPAECPQRAQVHARVEEYLGHERTSVRGKALVRRAKVGFSVELTLERGTESSQRRLDAADCDDLANAVALLLAVTADPVRAQATYEARVASAAEVQTPAPVPAVEPEPTSEPEPADAIASDDPTALASGPAPRASAQPAPRRAPAWLQGPTGFLIALGFAGGAGVSPAGQYGPRIALGWRFRSVRVEAFGHYWAPRPLDLGAGTGSVQAGAGGLRACPRFFAGRVELPLCAGLEGGAHTFSADDAAASDATGPWLAARLDFGARVPLASRVALWVEAGTAIALVDTEFSLQSGDSWSPSPLSAEAALGLSFFFGPRDGN